jgi:hypothetical protein
MTVGMGVVGGYWLDAGRRGLGEMMICSMICSICKTCLKESRCFSWLNQ